MEQPIKIMHSFGINLNVPFRGMGTNLCFHIFSLLAELMV